ncbi:helix-turn-helix domain-containing protein [Anaerosinus sp.]|uniref:helix-turn-helix domain-containing protein n=1 Tax=Selenobaculum sp. TaxID=3074374 RepID=UPI003AB137B2
MYNQQLLMHVSDAGSLLGCSSQVVYQLIQRGELKAFKTGRAWKISSSSVIDYANSRLNK